MIFICFVIKFNIQNSFAKHDWSLVFNDMLPRWANRVEQYTKFGIIKSLKKPVKLVKNPRNKELTCTLKCKKKFRKNTVIFSFLSHSSWQHRDSTQGCYGAVTIVSRWLSRSPACPSALSVMSRWCPSDVPGLSRCCHDECDRNEKMTVFVQDMTRYYATSILKSYYVYGLLLIK